MINKKWRKKELWENYWSRPYINYRKHHELFWNLIRSSSFGSVLDLGCGPACVWEGTSFTVTGIDYSNEAIREATTNFPNGRFLVANLDNRLPVDEKYDTIVLCGVVNYFPDFSNLISEIKRLSKDGTRVIVTINDLYGLNNRYWDEEAISREFSKWGIIDRTLTRFYDKIGWFIVLTVML